MSAVPGGWSVEFRSGTAQELHSLAAPDASGRVVRVMSVTAPSIVLGSAQADSVVDHDRAAAVGVTVARRRSGGGAVLLVPGEHVWVDLFVPIGDELWDDDVVAAAGWVGQAWRSAARSIGMADLAVHRGGMIRSRWSSLVCFAGRGPGEVFAGDRKLVGVSQRRTRAWVRVQTAVHLEWNGARTIDVLALSPAERVDARADLEGTVASVDHEHDGVVASLLANLPA